ncbi:hypothetical protein HMPREF0299_5112 [Corynebacterium matruchotii ATCC 14266]|uniref:Uncharacterized protein n=1 Tax=Corynebacterium matruchotii ATCC 14266 TaxID=553207 RepID=E0DHG0_9CORY|nr:hypothetical protein HMPREF0299_5112 [Corynebacterium matruchotii ATCC 14266]
MDNHGFFPPALAVDNARISTQHGPSSRLPAVRHTAKRPTLGAIPAEKFDNKKI